MKVEKKEHEEDKKGDKEEKRHMISRLKKTYDQKSVKKKKM